jgi:HlyD family secretion protein
VKRSALLAAAAAGLLVAGIAAYTISSGRQSGSKEYRTESVTRGAIIQRVSANGTLNPVVLISVGTQVSGTVRRIHVDFNERVRKGQVLLELDDALLAAQSRQSAAGVLSAQAALDLAIANEARQRDLVARKFVSPRELDQAVQQLKAAEAALAVARAQAERDRVNLAYSVIRSPIDGVVIDRVVDVGQTVAASFQTPELIRIAGDLRQMQIDTSFAEADIGAIRVGQTARFTVDAHPDRSFEGRVTQIRLNPSSEQNVVTYNVVIAVDNRDALLLPGMTATVAIAVAERQDALRLPNAALRFRPATVAGTPANRPADRSGGDKQAAGGTTVWRLDSGKPVSTAVEIGISDGRHTELRGETLPEGSPVIIGDSRAEQPRQSGSRFRMF